MALATCVSIRSALFQNETQGQTMSLDVYQGLYAVAWGFVAAGIMSSTYQMITNAPPKFELRRESPLSWLVSLVFTAFVAPYIIMRNAVRGRLLTGRPVGWLVASFFIAGVWSMLSGKAILAFMGAMAGA